MNLLLVSEYFPPKIMGGGEINLDLIAKALAQQPGIKVAVLTAKVNGLPANEKKEGVAIYRTLRTGKKVNSWFSNLARSTLFAASAAREIKRLQKENAIDAIHFIGNSIIIAPKIKKFNIPLFATIESYPTLCPKGDRMYLGKKECSIQCSLLHFLRCQQQSDEIGKMKNKFYLKYNPLFLLYVYRYYKRLNKALQHCRLIAISDYVKGLLTLHGQQSTVIPNIIDFKSYYFQQPHHKKPLILYLGSLTKYKGPFILLEAVRGLDCRCELYGEGILREDLLGLIKEYNLDAEIFSPVPYQEVPALYAKADLIVFPSLWPEPFGRIALEAIAAGKPVIGSDIGAIRETLANAENYVFPAGDSTALRKRIQEIITISPLNDITIRPEREKIMEKYSANLISNQLQEAYAGLKL